MTLERDKRWEIFHDDISFENFVSDKIPKIKFKNAVNVQIKEVFNIIQKLLAHSYFEYQFIDIAVTKALQSLEMALKIRYQELNGRDWNKSAPLEQLIKWFEDKNYFELDRPDFFQHVRKTRNHLSHPSGDQYGGSVSIHWIDTTVELINDLYESVDLRKQRKLSEEKFLESMNSFLTNGAKFILGDKETFIYGCGNVVLSNKIAPMRYHVGLLPVFDIRSFEIKYPLLIEIQDVIDSNLKHIGIVDEKGVEGTIHRLIAEDEIERVNEFRIKINTDQNFSTHHSSLLFDVENYLRDVRRANQFLDEVD